MSLTEWLRKLDIDLSPKQVRRFGIILSVLLLVLFGVRSWILHDPQWVGFVTAMVLAVTSLAAPGIVRTIYVPWMILARSIGFVFTHLLLGIIFYVIFTPVGLAMKILGRDPLGLKRNRESYWIERKPDQSTNYERMF